MSGANDTSELHAAVHAGLLRAIASIDAGHAAILRDQAGQDGAESLQYAPTHLCLAVARRLGAAETAAVAAAGTLAALVEMARTFAAIAGPGGAVAVRWGLPRTLNAVDAFYVLAQKLLGGLPPTSPAASRLAAAAAVDAALRAFAADLSKAPDADEGVIRSVRMLYPAALALAGLAAGLDTAAIGRLAEAGGHPALTVAPAGSLPPEVAAIIDAVATA
jgi:hypothetical protein